MIDTAYELDSFLGCFAKGDFSVGLVKRHWCAGSGEKILICHDGSSPPLHKGATRHPPINATAVRVAPDDGAAFMKGR